MCFYGIEGAQKATSGQYDLVVLDIMLPGKDGFSILEEIRRMQPETRVIILSAKGELDDKLKGLEHGADDYMTKPFHFEELIARVNLQLRKKNEESGEILSLGNLQLDRKKGLLYNESNGQTLPISGKEYALTEYFLEHPSQILSVSSFITKSGVGITISNPITLKLICPLFVKSSDCWESMFRLKPFGEWGTELKRVKNETAQKRRSFLSWDPFCLYLGF